MLCSVQRPCTDVLAHPHKEPLMSALPTKDAGTNKDSIVIRPKKNSLWNEDCEQETIHADNTVSNNTLLHLKWYVPFHKCHHMVSIHSLCLLSCII